MTQETLTAFFGWMTVLNFGLMAFSAVTLLAVRDWVAATHAKMFGLEKNIVLRTYFSWLAQFKLFSLVFALSPYIALKLI